MPEITNNTVIDIESKIPDDDRETMIKVENVGMTFNMASEQLNSLKEYAIALFKRNLFFKELRALDNISFEIKKGDVYGILGTNGSGKSTLLKIVAGVLDPTDGKVSINGSIAPLIELGAGFDMELTARENIYLNGALMGYTKEFINEHFDDIVEFAEIDKFLDMPMKNYSSGMIARIAFAIATIIVPEILIVDEVLSVGDFMFQKKCEERIQKLIKDYGTTVLIVSHSIDQIERMCNKAIWIEKGKTRINGLAEDVCSIYSLIGGRTGSLEAENKIIEAYKNTQDIDIQDLKDNYYDASEKNYCDACIDLVKHATSDNKSFSDVVLVSPVEHIHIALGNSIAGALECPLLVYDINKPDLTLLDWLSRNKPKRIFILDRLGCEATKVIKDMQFSWVPEIIDFNSNDISSQLEWNLNIIDYLINNGIKFSNECIVVAYNNNKLSSAALASMSYRDKKPIISFSTTEDNIRDLLSSQLMNQFKKISIFDPQIMELISQNYGEFPSIIHYQDITLVETFNNNDNINQILVVPDTEEMFQLYAPIGFYCNETNSSLMFVDNTNLESIRKACDYATNLRVDAISFIQGNIHLTNGIVQLIVKQAFRDNI